MSRRERHVSLVWMPVDAGEKTSENATQRLHRPEVRPRTAFSTTSREAVVAASLAITRAVRRCRSWREIVFRKLES